jgi:hypothetical protein
MDVVALTGRSKSMTTKSTAMVSLGVPLKVTGLDSRSTEHTKLLALAHRIQYSLRPILLFANIDVSRYILMINISVLAKNNIGQKEYFIVANKDGRIGRD